MPMLQNQVSDTDSYTFDYKLSPKNIIRGELMQVLLQTA